MTYFPISAAPKSCATSAGEGNMGLRTTDMHTSSKSVINKQRKLCECRISHPVTVVSTVSTGRGRVVVMAGANHISCSFLGQMMSELPCPNSLVHQTFPVCKGKECMGGPTKCLSGTQTISLDYGEVCCMDLAPLPTADYAVGVAGTTNGAVVMFLLHGGMIHKTKEVSLHTLSMGDIGPIDSIRNVVLGIDPAG